MSELVRNAEVLAASTLAGDVGGLNSVRLRGPFVWVAYEAEPPQLSEVDGEMVDGLVRVVGRACEERCDSAQRGHDLFESFCKSVEADFRLIGRSAVTGYNHPLVNGMWLTYRAGMLPVSNPEVEGDLREFIGLSAEQARAIIEPVLAKMKQAEAAKQEAVEERNEAVKRSLSEIDGLLPSTEVLRELIGGSPNLPALSEPEARWATTVDELNGIGRVPPAWRRLVTDQDAGRELSWEPLWSEVSDIWPAAMEFLKTKCRGVAVVSGAGLPIALLYVYAYESEYAPTGVGLGANWGPKPLGKRVRKAVRERFDHLPERLQEFYRTVHDGWCEFGFLDGGPAHLERMKLLGEDVSNEDCFESGDRPFDVDDALVVVRTGGGGDGICLDTAHDPPRPFRWWHDEPSNPEMGIEFWNELNELTSTWCEQLLPRDAGLA